MPTYLEKKYALRPWSLRVEEDFSVTCVRCGAIWPAGGYPTPFERTVHRAVCFLRRVRSLRDGS